MLKWINAKMDNAKFSLLNASILVQNPKNNMFLDLPLKYATKTK